MAQEEKAKAYDEAYKRVANRFGSNVADELFPELAESEDEKIVDAIRKALESKIEDLGNGVTKTACLAWLEKQGEQKSVDKEYTFKAIPRLLDMMEPTEKAKAYCQKLIDTHPLRIRLSQNSELVIG